MSYYKIPFSTIQIINGKTLEGAENIRDSIRQNIRLILKSESLNYRFDPTFGCLMNKFQGATPVQKRSERKWRENIRSSIQKNIFELLSKYETRIKIDEVIVNLNRPVRISNNVKVNLDIQIRGNLSLGSKEKFHFPDSEVEQEAKELFPLMIPIN